MASDFPKPQHPALPRRTFLQAGTIGILGLGMGELNALRATETHAGKAPGPNSKAKSVIYIFLSGGLSQHESFDLKPDAPDSIRGEFRPIATRTPGMWISEHLPRLAERSHLFALVRSLTHPFNGHSEGHLAMLAGRSQMPRGFDANAPRPTDWPSLAAVANYLTSPRNNLPPAVILPQSLIHYTGRTIPGQFAGQMGPRWDPWIIKAASECASQAYGACPDCFRHDQLAHQHPSQPVFQAPNLSLPQGLGRGRLGERLHLLSIIDEQRRNLESEATTGSLDRYRQQAVSLLADARTQKAFDVVHADPKIQDRYGRNQFGWSLLMARRLVEAGVNLVQVNLGNNETWDTHQAMFPNLKDKLFPPTDRALSALLDDLHESGLLDSTLIVMAGEFGRTPKISTLAIPGVKLPGRDHWGAVQTVFFAGGGVRGGTVIGSSDKNGAFPSSCPQTPENMAATIYSALGLPPTIAWNDPAGRPHHIYFGEPIGGLM
ncbi:MAG TPA: DUF1501 domain-containing protein [Gemmataceae bacterium]|nr:DUF1501 domain-containing protein [Gemmataceae bacterium]